MKDLILSHIKAVQLILDDVIYPLKEDHDPFGKFFYYWHVLEFINWIKDTKPDVYESNDLETCFKTVDEFGEVYLEVFKPNPMPFRYEDGILGIAVPIDTMIREFYDYVIELKEEETPTLQTILNSFNQFGAEILNVIGESSTINKKEIAKDIVKEVLQPTKPAKKLTEKEQYQQDLENLKAERMLKGIRKHTKK
ncbi:MAG: hypothetical protein JWR38_5919 [Mucilaginibacter sp.]|nr:hypothetical protein [Mucilaginibacter sp.]